MQRNALYDRLFSRIESATNGGGKKWEGAGVPWRQWLHQNFSHVATAEPAEHHADFWQWIEALRPGIAPPAFVACWPRGGGKSTTVELGIVYVAVNLTRRFALIVSETQDQADERVKSVQKHLTSLGITNAVSSLGHSLGWRANQLRTENGFNVVGIGLDKATRGVKLDIYRPDWIIFDDIDGRLDTPETTKKKQTTITESILKAGAVDLAATFVQNLIHDASLMAQVVAGTADFLLDRNPVRVVKAVHDLQVQQEKAPDGSLLWRIIGGIATWAGQSLQTCEKDINRSGLRAFLRESQQEVKEESGGMWDRALHIEPYRVTSAPPLMQVGVGVDPTGSSTGDEAGILVAGIAMVDGVLHGYITDDRSLHGTPGQWANASVSAYNQNRARVLIAEKNFGGDMVESVIKSIPGAPEVELVHHAYGKDIRAEPVLKLYEEGRIHHVGIYPQLEKEMCSWLPGAKKSPNRLDALVIILTRLIVAAEFLPPLTSGNSLGKRTNQASYTRR